MNHLIQRLHEPDVTIAIVGATDDRSKYGNIIYRDLRAKGYRVFAVNPGRRTVEGDPCWPDLADLPEPPGIVNIVVPPPRTLEVVQTAQRLGLDGIWIQPGAADGAVRRFLQSVGVDALIGPCIMVEAPHRRSTPQIGHDRA